MVALNYIGVISANKLNTLTNKDAKWFLLNETPTLAYDHNEILFSAREKLKELVLNTSILKSLFPNYFTIPELQKTYEIILNKKLDRRNFRRKVLYMLTLTDKEKIFECTKPAKLYKYKK